MRARPSPSTPVHRGRGVLHAVAALVALSGCDPGDPARDDTLTRDSAGIRIIENPAPSTAPEWSLAEPSFALGTLEGEEAYELYQPRHALRLTNGGIVVANQGTEELRFYDDGGVHVRTVGRSGGGPGEFQDLWGLYRLPGDSLAAWDWTAKRLTVYDEAGAFIRMVTPAFETHFAPRILGILEDRTGVMIRGFNPGAIFASGGGTREDSVVLPRFDLTTGSQIDSAGPFAGAQRYAHMGEGSFWIRTIVFGREEHFATGRNTIVVGDDRTGEVRSYDPGGRLRRIVRLPPEDRSVTAEHLARYRERQLEGVEPSDLPEERRRLDELPVADRLPAFDELFVDRADRVWLRAFDAYYDRPDPWIILDTDGTLLARLSLPSRTRPLDAGGDYLLAYHQDDLEVEHVVLYPLVTGATTP